MVLTIDLAPDEELRLRAAANRLGVEVTDCLHRLIAEHLQPPVSDRSTIDLLRSWREQDATDDPLLLAEAAVDLEQFKTNLDEDRRAAGSRILYP